jgi:hypothetical protein
MLEKPDVVVLGVGHSGTSLLTHMLFKLGWRRNDADRVFCESTRLREINDRMLVRGESSDSLMKSSVAFLKQLDRPFALKDPRLVITLGHWVEALERVRITPGLLRIRRRRAALKKSYVERSELVRGGPGAYGRTLGHLLKLSERMYEAWDWPKMTIDYESLVAAATLVQLSGKRRAVGGLWHPSPGPRRDRART